MLERPFPASEYRSRLRRARERMAERELDALVVASPENMFYLCGLDSMGYFACQLLVVLPEGPPILITREVERATVEDMVPGVRHVGYRDGGPPSPGALPPPAATALELLRELGLAEARLGLEMDASFLPYRVASSLVAGLPRASWQDGSSLVASCRLMQSPLELERTRAAARVADAMMLAAIAAAGPGIAEREVMAAIYDALLRHGGTYPGFVPLVRTTETLAHEHSTWRGRRLERGDLLFVEMAGCVQRYHAPIGRLIHIGEAPAEAERVHAVAGEAMARLIGALAPGASAADAYRAWQGELDRAGLARHTRHHCGYAVGIGYPPAWTGGSGPPVGLREDATFELREGMVFHLMSWLLGTGRGDAFLSHTAVVTDRGCEVLSTLPKEVIVR